MLVVVAGTIIMDSIKIDAIVNEGSGDNLLAIKIFDLVTGA